MEQMTRTWTAMKHCSLLAACSLALLVALAGCGGKRGQQELREGSVAELQGDWELARQKYAAACALENGEAFRKLAALSLRHDTELILQETPKNEAWADASRKLSQKISNIGREAARRGFPVENLDGELAAFEASVEKAFEETCEVERVAREAKRQAEERRLEAERLAEERLREAERQAEEKRRKAAVTRLREEESRIELEIKEAEKEIKDCGEKTEKFEGLINDTDAFQGFLMLSVMDGTIDPNLVSDHESAYRFGQELGMEFNRLKARKKDLEESLPNLRRNLEEIHTQIAALQDAVNNQSGSLRTIQTTLKEANGHAGETRTITLPGGAEMEMVWCPLGSFHMGSPDTEKGRFNGETYHPVTLTDGFWIAKYEVTQSQWKSVMGNNPSQHKGDNFPVESVSWDDCREFCQKTTLRLPTEAEWEYACRAGSETAYFWGNDPDGNRMNYGNNKGGIVPVGSYAPNAWGLYDMHGNVNEWCADWHGEYSWAERNPTGRTSGWARVLRGGSWNYNAELCRSATRSFGDPADRLNDTGFRPCFSAETR